MNQIHAFVGHSFTSDDEEIVRVFLRYFDDVKRLGIGFDWVHAESAEPLDLRDKVLRLADGANLFIGICTSKERAVGLKALSSTWFFKDRLSAKESQFSTKTSDWIIQEIGFAIGKGMKLLLLVEEGLRQPGGLQGNIEYITFSRTAPEKSFGRILQMIQSLLVDASSTGLQTQELPKSGTPEMIDDDLFDQSWKQPKIDWIRADYSLALIRAMSSKEFDLAESIYDAYLATPNAKESDNSFSWESERAYWRIIFRGDGSAISIIQKLAKEHPNSAGVLVNLGHAYSNFDEFQKAGEIYGEAAKNEKDAGKSLQHLTSALTAYAAAENRLSADGVVEQIKQIALNNESLRPNVLGALREFAEKIKNDNLYVGVSEKFLSLSPGDSGVRFSLAFKYSQMNRHVLAFFHYSRIPIAERNKIVWNNLGVAYNNLKLKIKAIDAFRRSANEGETLAMSNLASDFLQAGFKDEARALCEKAITIPEHHARVPSVLVSIGEEEDRENKKIEELKREANSLHSFFVEFGEASLNTKCGDAAGIWKGPRCELNFKIKDGILDATGTYQVEAGGIIGAALLGLSGTKLPPQTMTVSITGKVFGLSAECEMQIRELGRDKSKTVLGLLGDTKLLIAITKNFDHASVYEPDASPGSKFYNFTPSD